MRNVRAMTTLTIAPKRLNAFERYLSVWVGLCMAVGVGLGLAAPGAMRALRGLEFGAGSQINAPIAVLIWLMITPMMMKVDFGSIRNVGRRPRGLFVTLFVNWLIKPFSMALVAWLIGREYARRYGAARGSLPDGVAVGGGPGAVLVQ